MNISKLAALSLALAGSLGAGLAQAHANVQWSLSIAGPIGVSLYSAPYAAPVYTQPYAEPVYTQPYAAPVYSQPYAAPVYTQPYAAPFYTRPVMVQAPVYVHTGYGRGWHDRDGDGIPNRFDHRYNPRWDRDGDGLPNRYDHHYNPPGDRHGQGGQNRNDEHEGRGRGH